MKLNNLSRLNQLKNRSLIHTNNDHSKNKKKISVDLNKQDKFIKSDDSKRGVSLYTRKSSLNRATFDKGTAVETTVKVNRSAFDRIVNETTYGETKWEELGVDNNKRWVVVNGQRFEVEHSAEEKARRKNVAKTLVDYMNESEEKMKEQNKFKAKKTDKLSSNIETLKNNEELMNLLGNIFGLTSSEEILKALL